MLQSDSVTGPSLVALRLLVGAKFVAEYGMPNGAAGVNGASGNESLHFLNKPSHTSRRWKGFRLGSALSGICVDSVEKSEVIMDKTQPLRKF